MQPESVTVSAPGRVNLIGEHTDYSLLPVLPIAIQKRLQVHAEATGDGVVQARSEQFGGVFHSDAAENPSWSHYLSTIIDLVGAGDGARLTIDGDLPSTGGLSSSSALTVASLLALIRLNDNEPEPEGLVDLAVRAERATGVEGGAMDQTLIVHAMAGTALRIDFDPLASHRVEVPEEIAFVAGYSGKPATKDGPAGDAYNARVVGTRTAALLLGATPPFLANVDGEVADLLAALPEEALPPPEAIGDGGAVERLQEAADLVRAGQLARGLEHAAEVVAASHDGESGGVSVEASGALRAAAERISASVSANDGTGNQQVQTAAADVLTYLADNVGDIDGRKVVELSQLIGAAARGEIEAPSTTPSHPNPPGKPVPGPSGSRPGGRP